jgi:hypothetical protein
MPASSAFGGERRANTTLLSIDRQDSPFGRIRWFSRKTDQPASGRNRERW